MTDKINIFSQSVQILQKLELKNQLCYYYYFFRLSLFYCTSHDNASIKNDLFVRIPKIINLISDYAQNNLE